MELIDALAVLHFAGAPNTQDKIRSLYYPKMKVRLELFDEAHKIVVAHARKFVGEEDP